MKKNQKSSANQESIEYLLGELKKITNQLESESTSIDESIDLCEKGNNLLKICKEKLAAIQLKVYDFEKIKIED